MISNKKKWDEDSNVLIGGFKKIGVGFDSKMKVLILASDVMDIRQYEGRIRAHDNTIIDIVDDFGTLESHFEGVKGKYEGRRGWYLERGATIITEGDHPSRPGRSRKGHPVAPSESTMRMLLKKTLKGRNVE